MRMFVHNSRELKGFLLLHRSPCPPAALCIARSGKRELSQCRSLCPDSNVHWQISSPRGELPRGKLPRGEVHRVVILVCLHYLRFKAAVSCLQHCQKYNRSSDFPLENACEKQCKQHLSLSDQARCCAYACLSDQTPAVDGCDE